MNQKLCRLLAVLAVVCLLTACPMPQLSTCAAAYPDFTPEEAIHQAAVIVIGAVEHVALRLRKTGDTLVPDYVATVTVEQAVRGEYQPGEQAVVVMACASFLRADERVLLLLVKENDALTPVGGPQSKYQLTADGQALNGLGSTDRNRNTTLAQLLTLIAQLPSPPTPAVAETVMPETYSPTATPAGGTLATPAP